MRRKKKTLREPMGPRGRVEITVAQGAPIITPGDRIPAPANIVSLQNAGLLPKVYKSAKVDFSQAKILSVDTDHNIIVNQGRDKILTSLTSGFVLVIARMSMGDKGTIPSDSTVPKIPTAAQTALFNEVFRSDIETTVLTVGVPDPTVEFIKTFSAADVPITSFSNQSLPVINEVGLIMADLLGGTPLPRPDVASPAIPLSDEVMFATRTFQSVPFQAANEITVTIRYTIFIE